MSRIGKKPVPIPGGVSVDLAGTRITVKGPKGSLTRDLPPLMQVSVAGSEVVVARPNDEQRSKALHGLTRTLVANMVEGVEKGFERVLEIQGVGYKAEPTAKGIKVLVGFSHPVLYDAPEGIKFAVENNTVVKVSGPNKELVGQVASELRAIRPPEPYKGKGIRYQGEQVRRKAGKTGAK